MFSRVRPPKMMRSRHKTMWPTTVPLADASMVVARFARADKNPGEDYKHVAPLGAGAQGFAALVEDVRYPDSRVVLKESDVTTMEPAIFQRSCAEVVNLSMAANHGNVVRLRDAWLRLNHLNPTVTPQVFRIVVVSELDPGLPDWITPEEILVDSHNTQRITLCIVMDYANGGTLANQVSLAREKGQLISEDKICVWIGQIALGVHHLHKLGILHRDLKTANVFLTQTGCVKIGDLGVSKLLVNSEDGMARTTTGTPLFMAPEVLSGKPYDYPSDAWSIGCILAELLTGEHAFKSTSLAELYARIERAELATPIPAAYSQELRTLIPKLLTTNSDDRMTVEELLRQPKITSGLRRLFGA